MKRFITIAAALVLIAASAGAQQGAFTNTIQDYRSNVIDFREDGLYGALRDGVVVEPSPADLKVGDVFIDADGRAKKVAAVSRAGGDLYIDTVKPEFYEVFLYVEIPDQTVAISSAPAASAPKGTYSVEYNKEIYKKDSATITVYGSVALTGNISVGFKAPSVVQIEIHTWKFWEWSFRLAYESGYLRANVDYDLNVTSGLKVHAEKSVESKPFLLYGFGTPTAGISAGLGLYTKTILEGSFDFDLPVSFRVYGGIGVGCTLDGQFPYMVPTGLYKSGGTNFRVGIDPVITASGALKQKFYLGGDVTVAGIKITEFEAGGGPYVRLTGTLNGSIYYDTGADPKFGATLDVQATGEIGVFTGVSGKVCDGKWSFSLFDKEFPIKSFEWQAGASMGLSAGARSPFAAPLGAETISARRIPR